MRIMERVENRFVSSKIAHFIAFLFFLLTIKNDYVNLNMNVRPFLYRGNYRICHLNSPQGA